MDGLKNPVSDGVGEAVNGRTDATIGARMIGGLVRRDDMRAARLT
jgi:hypothetical protein